MSPTQAISRVSSPASSASRGTFMRWSPPHWRPADGLGAAVHKGDAPNPKRDRLPHVTHADLEFGKSVEHACGHHAYHVCADLHAIAPHGGVHSIVLEGTLETVGSGARMDVDASIKRLGGFEHRPVLR